VTIALFGHRGFIGVHLQQMLLQRGIAFECFNGDITDSAVLNTFFTTQQFDIAIHLAGQFSGDGQTLITKNVTTTQAILQQCQLHSVQKILFTSTGAVYGDPQDLTSSEESPLHPNTLYGLTKLLAEEVIQYYHKNHGIEYAILRYPNVYGPGNRKGVLYSMISKALRDNSVTLNGDGMQSRHFLHVDDAVNAILIAIGHQDSGTFNITNENQVFIKDIAQHLHKTLGAEIKREPLTNGLAHLLLDPNKAHNELGFLAKIHDIQFQQIIDQVNTDILAEKHGVQGIETSPDRAVLQPQGPQ